MIFICVYIDAHTRSRVLPAAKGPFLPAGG
jgi:hypothetical protein